MTSYERWSLILAGAGVAINATLFVVVLFQLGALRLQIRETSAAEIRDHDRRRKQATIETFTSTMQDRRALRSLLPADVDGRRIQELAEASRSRTAGLGQ